MIVLILVLGTVASAGGLFLPELYRDTAWTVPQNRGQDLITMAVALSALVAALQGFGRGSARAMLIWIGLLGYMFYTYMGASFAYAFNEFFLSTWRFSHSQYA